MKKAFGLLTIIMLLTMALAACGPAGAELTCPEGDTCVEVGADEPIRVGWMMVVSGGDASLGTDTKRGVEIAIDDKGELLGHQIELVGEDELCNAEGGQTAATKLAADPKLAAIVGSNCSSAARAAIPIVCGANIPMISPSNTAPDLTDAARPAEYWCYMRTAHNDLVQGAAMADYAYGEGFRNAATVHDGSIYADQLQQVFAARFQELGGTIVAQEAVGPDDTDMKPMLTRVAAAGPDFIYYPIFIKAGGQITKQAREVAGLEEVQLAGADGIFSPDFLSAAGDAVMGFNWSSPDFSAFGAGYGDFLTKHETKYGEKTLAPFHAHAYDAANVVFAAIEKVAVQGEDGSMLIPRKALHAAMAATANFSGLTGNLTCGETGDCADPKIAVYECVNSDPASWNPGAVEGSNPIKIWP
ncbi:MAG TPA: branched-chain amino acid ABC transporter substrate-binding protein [Anaerolineae bacterium]|nr:branched-chain amino acid ABC transporter substrate-binding protein [Anaerolineae bacterium]